MDRPIVLIIDDEPLISTMVEATFEDAGFEVRCVLDAAEAAQQIAELDTRLSAIVTDIRLGPGPNGWALAVDARTKLPLLPIVYMTGDSAADWTAFGVPRSILVQKPFVGAQVLAAVMTLMNSDNTESPSA
ncbi:MAG TPA: response regulator [Brevundimonas sp.]|jgi:DNA-binding response OmpR family regulator